MDMSLGEKALPPGGPAASAVSPLPDRPGGAASGTGNKRQRVDCSILDYCGLLFMRPIILSAILLIFILTACLNCMLYGSVAKIPYFGVTIAEYAEKERDIFLQMYIAGGNLLPRKEKFADISMSLVRRSYEGAFRNAPRHSDPIGPYATGGTFDLPAILVRILYWFPPAALALLFLVILMPSRPQANEETL